MAKRSIQDARHEAAHAVVGVYLGLSLIDVKVGAMMHGADTVHGLTRFRGAPSKRLAMGIMYAAGPAAETIQGRPEWMGRGDRRHILDMLFTRKDFWILEDIAKRYLEGPGRRAWERVTEALSERDLTGKDVRELLRGETLEY